MNLGSHECWIVLENSVYKVENLSNKNDDNNTEDSRIVEQVIKRYSNENQCIKQIKENSQQRHISSLPYATAEEVDDKYQKSYKF